MEKPGPVSKPPSPDPVTPVPGPGSIVTSPSPATQAKEKADSSTHETSVPTPPPPPIEMKEAPAPAIEMKEVVPTGPVEETVMVTIRFNRLTGAVPAPEENVSMSVGIEGSGDLPAFVATTYAEMVERLQAELTELFNPNAEVLAIEPTELVIEETQS